MAKQDADTDSPETWVDPHWDTGRQLLRDLRFEIVQLDLLASRTVHHARLLEMAHDKERRRLLLLVRPGQDGYEGRQTARVKIKELQSALLEGHAQISAWAWAGRCRPAVSCPSSLADLCMT